MVGPYEAYYAYIYLKVVNSLVYFYCILLNFRISGRPTVEAAELVSMNVDLYAGVQSSSLNDDRTQF